ncbi:50S ribosomal protein L31 [Candidatus Woesebacteria bacterium RIFCSPHIGHO2_01_FULL_41_10]|uniref:50S ribosomal protein L31 n=1 Tax=Candidatus Woesebacteria bacterium RIFCSPHIGHO2_01_FULL_41_10 TaxID=1802500 RepID=A0A1F7YNZ0_9BACT|nr:MAG: 50S ribosomal protein L31 [Candidatus Woesebacteria bacterium RIFCSPHIGHO2_01_FULL_41_10]
MKKAIHPKWYEDAKVIVNDKVVMHVGATQPEIRVEIWAGTHPFYTGQMKYVDTAGRVDAYEARRNKASKGVLSKTKRRTLKREKKIATQTNRPGTLSELRSRTTGKKKAKKNKK